MFLAPIHETRFKSFGSKAISSFIVNGRDIKQDIDPFSQSLERGVDLNPYLYTGANFIHIDLDDTAEIVTFYLQPDVKDACVLSGVGLALLMLDLAIRWLSISFLIFKLQKVKQLFFC